MEIVRPAYLCRKVDRDKDAEYLCDGPAGSRAVGRACSVPSRRTQLSLAWSWAEPMLLDELWEACDAEAAIRIEKEFLHIGGHRFHIQLGTSFQKRIG